MPVLEHGIYKVFLGDNERVVPSRVIPIHIWGIQATQALTRVQDGDITTTTIINKEQRLLSKNTVNICYEELILDNPCSPILNRILKRRKVRIAYRRLIISKIGEFAQSMTMPNVRPIFVIVSDLITYVSRQIMEITIEEVSNQALNAAITMSEEDEGIKVVPAAKSSIDKLEKVKTNIDGLCSVCFEEFEGEAEEVARMPCSHVYHTHCIVKWLEYNHVCPLCRFEMPKSVD